MGGTGDVGRGGGGDAVGGVWGGGGGSNAVSSSCSPGRDVFDVCRVADVDVFR